VLDDAAALHLRAFVVGQQPVGDAAQDARICELSEAFAAICALRGVPFAAAVLDWLPETPLVALTPAPGAQPIPHPYRFAGVSSHHLSVELQLRPFRPIGGACMAMRQSG